MDRHPIAGFGCQQKGRFRKYRSRMHIFAYAEHDAVETRNAVRAGQFLSDQMRIALGFGFGRLLTPNPVHVRGRHGQRREQQALGGPEVALRIVGRHAALVHPVKANPIPIEPVGERSAPKWE